MAKLLKYKDLAIVKDKVVAVQFYNGRIEIITGYKLPFTLFGNTRDDFNKLIKELENPL